MHESSPGQGNSYLYKTNCCGVNVGIDFKLASIKQ